MKTINTDTLLILRDLWINGVITEDQFLQAVEDLTK